VKPNLFNSMMPESAVGEPLTGWCGVCMSTQIRQKAPTSAMGTTQRIDRSRVSLATEAERLYWETKLSARRSAIEDALAEVGANPGMVADWLVRHRRPRLQPDAKGPA
jgi:hypothetical protein